MTESYKWQSQDAEEFQDGGKLKLEKLCWTNLLKVPSYMLQVEEWGTQIHLIMFEQCSHWRKKGEVNMGGALLLLLLYLNE